MNEEYAYGLIDRYLRNTLDDDGYAEMLEALDSLCMAQPAQQGEPVASLSEINAELLEALQHIMRSIPVRGFAQIHWNSSTWHQIDAAITKATGGTP